MVIDLNDTYGIMTMIITMIIMVIIMIMKMKITKIPIISAMQSNFRQKKIIIGKPVADYGLLQ